MFAGMIAFLMLAAAGESQRLTAVRDSYPSLSPDGQMLLFHSNRAGRQAIWAADGDGSNPRIFFDRPDLGSDPGTPVWSPDGRVIAFGMRPAGSADESESEIYVIAPDGSGLRRLTETAGDDSHPHWSRSGRIYFNSARATADPSAPWLAQWIDVYSMAADGSDVRRHSDCRGICTYPVPSPDERWIAYRRIVPGAGRAWDQSAIERNSEIFVAPLDGGAPRNLTDNPAYDGWPMWSPDGHWLVFASNRDAVPNVGQVYAVRPDGSGLRRLTEGRWSRVQPSFDAAGERMLVYEGIEEGAFESGHIASMRVELVD